jgi:hypothetical protein
VSTVATFRRNRLELDSMNNSLAAAIPWRYEDHAEFLLKALEILATDDSHAEVAGTTRPNPQAWREIFYFLERQQRDVQRTP